MAPVSDEQGYCRATVGTGQSEGTGALASLAVLACNVPTHECITYRGIDRLDKATRSRVEVRQQASDNDKEQKNSGK